MRGFQVDSALLAAHPGLAVAPHHQHSPGIGGLSRRGFIGGAAGVAGALMGASLVNPVSALAAKPNNAAPKPIPDGTTVNGQLFHFKPFRQGQEPASITDFHGLVGVADVRGTGTATNPDGTSETLLFDTDMRFMKGVYVGQDGDVHSGAFGFVWLDLYRGQFDFTNFSTQVHDFDPGITPYPIGLFWTLPLPRNGVSDVSLESGEARMIGDELDVADFFSIPNALFRFLTPASVAASTSFDIRWRGPVTDRAKVRDPKVGFAGTFILNQATMTWSAANDQGFRFRSHPSGTTSFFAQLGRMRNGRFFDADDDLD
jgi:hypothetical protein